MRQEEVDVEGTSLSEQFDGGIQSCPFLAIGTPCGSLAQIQKQFGRSRGLTHPMLLLSREQKFLLSPVYCRCTLLSSFFECRTDSSVRKAARSTLLIPPSSIGQRFSEWL